MQCSNRFGESILHAACRRGAVRTLEFLLEEGKVDVRVICDYGRTPLHDACWTTSANLQVVRLLLEQCPDLLHITDRRNSTPLDYIHKDNWAEWGVFLKNNADLVVPKEL
jgi:ankyrin repeat protein